MTSNYPLLAIVEGAEDKLSQLMVRGHLVLRLRTALVQLAHVHFGIVARKCFVARKSGSLIRTVIQI